MSTYEYIDIDQYVIVYFTTRQLRGYTRDVTTEFRQYKQDGQIRAFLNGHPDPSQTAMPAEVAAKLLELATYDVVFQKIESTQADTQILREVRQYRQYDKKDKNKGEFMQWNSEYPAKLSPITKEEVDHELALLPFRLDLQKIEAQKKAEQRRVLLEQHARNHADLEAEEVLQQQREEAIHRMIQQFPQFPEIGDFLRESVTQESDRKENKTIVDLQAQVLQLQAAPAQLQREIDTLKAANTDYAQVVGEKKKGEDDDDDDDDESNQSGDSDDD